MSYCGNFPTFKTNSASVTIECPLVDTIPDGTYSILEVDSDNKVANESNAFLVDLTVITTANVNSVEITRRR